ncbi:M48 family metallopeptidase [Sneathiella glossodoripedis]|uniref:M48 family metallopeptidase n=1 Tax=Sneathiella glossodoripedis TaxID=418853 RepID=UPI000470E0B2|nr:M48 family metallopeptidase [Sneathiella glossodoripedis]
MIRGSAEYFDGTSAQSQSVEIQVHADNLEIRDLSGVLIAVWSMDLIRDENIPKEDGQLFLSLSDASNSRLRVKEQILIDAIRARCPKLYKRRGRLIKNWSMPVIATAAVLAGLAAFVWIGIPYAADPISRLIPEKVLAKMGEGVEGQIVERIARGKSQEEVICRGAGAEKTLSRLTQEFTKIVTGDEAGAIVNSITVVKSKHANAFALPGGRMVIFSGLLDKSTNANAFVGVLAHEFVHINERHPSRLMVSNIGIAALLSVALGDVSGGTVVAAFGQMALGASYSREMEEIADREALRIMDALSYDMKPLIPLLKELDKKVAGNSFTDILNTHPGIEDRISIIEKQDPQEFKPPMSESEWAALKTICQKSI